MYITKCYLFWNQNVIISGPFVHIEQQSLICITIESMQYVVKDRASEVKLNTSEFIFTAFGCVENPNSE